nr:hypothetical protein [uncultured Rhodopila sp.]
MTIEPAGGGEPGAGIVDLPTKPPAQSSRVEAKKSGFFALASAARAPHGRLFTPIRAHNTTPP